MVAVGDLLTRVAVRAIGLVESGRALEDRPFQARIGADANEQHRKSA
jgi:hypothetical protein